MALEDKKPKILVINGRWQIMLGYLTRSFYIGYNREEGTNKRCKDRWYDQSHRLWEMLFQAIFRTDVSGTRLLSSRLEKWQHSTSVVGWDTRMADFTAWEDREACISDRLHWENLQDTGFPCLRGPWKKLNRTSQFLFHCYGMWWWLILFTPPFFIIIIIIKD